MADKHLVDRDVKVMVKAGTNKNGKDILKTISMKNVRLDAKDEDAYAVAKAISSISELPLVKNIRSCR